MQQSLYAMGSE